MIRRRFLTLLAGLPFAGAAAKLFGEKRIPPYPWKDHVCGEEIRSWIEDHSLPKELTELTGPHQRLDIFDENFEPPRIDWARFGRDCREAHEREIADLIVKASRP